MLQNNFNMPCNMATDINGNGKPCDMRRICFYIYSESRYIPAEALRTYSEAVNSFEYFILESGIEIIAVSEAHIAA